MLLEFLHRYIGPGLDKVRVLQVVAQNDMAHGQCHRAVGSRMYRHPLVGEAGRVRQPYIEGDDLHVVVDAALGHALRQRVVEVGSFEDIGAEVEHVLGVGEVRGFDVRAPGGLHADFLRRFADRGVVHHSGRTQRVHEAVDHAAGAVATVLEHDGVRIFLERGVELAGQFGQRLVPGDSLPLAFASRADALQRIQDAIRVIAVPHAGVALGAQTAAGGDVLRVAFQLDHAIVLDVGDGAVLNVADVTVDRDGLAFGARDVAEILAAQIVFHGVEQTGRGGGGRTSGGADLEEGAACDFWHFHVLYLL